MGRKPQAVRAAIERRDFAALSAMGRAGAAARNAARQHRASAPSLSERIAEAEEARKPTQAEREVDALALAAERHDDQLPDP